MPEGQGTAPLPCPATAGAPAPEFALLGVPLGGAGAPEMRARTRAWLEGDRLHHIATVNPEYLVEAARDPAFRELLVAADATVCDGVGLVIWSRLLHGRRLPRLTGVELGELLCEVAAETRRSVYFIGGFGVAEAAAQAMAARHPGLRIAGAEDGDPAELGEAIEATQPDIVLVCFGAPKQEQWIARFRSRLPGTRIAVGLGGSFDFWAGRIRRAPAPLRALGLEWFWRLMVEPRTRARRIWRAVIVFSFLVVREKLVRRSSPTS